MASILEIFDMKNVQSFVIEDPAVEFEKSGGSTSCANLSSRFTCLHLNDRSTHE